MAIVRWDPFQDLMTIRDRMNRLFEETLTRGRDREEPAALGSWVPAVDIYETADSIVLKAEVPGARREDIDIQVRDNTLILRGERRVEKDVQEENYLRVERSYGAFHRAFTLPTIIQQDKIKAVFKDGVLEVSLPKAEEAKPKRVKVEVQ
ncbi:MAG: Hsp20/alpha crystallin family protein [Candidatus Methylomirabilales bacterium]